MAMDRKLLDDLAKITSGALGAAASLREEAEAQFRERVGEFVYRLDLVPREEFDAMRTVAETAREEQEAMAARVATLEGRIAALEAAASPAGGTAKAAAGPRRGRTPRKTKDGADDS